MSKKGSGQLIEALASIPISFFSKTSDNKNKSTAATSKKIFFLKNKSIIIYLVTSFTLSIFAKVANILNLGKLIDKYSKYLHFHQNVAW